VFTFDILSKVEFVRVLVWVFFCCLTSDNLRKEKKPSESDLLNQLLRVLG